LSVLRRGLAHSGALFLFAVLAIGWTWPLVRHLSDAIPGDPGDNYSFVWNLWWMRHVLATPGLAYFKTTYLFYPFGTTIADHPHTALPALIAATAMAGVSVVTAQNLLLLAYVFLNMTCAYALAWDITRQRRASVLAGILFGLSPYVAVHMLGHFDLVAAWVLPLFALAFRRAVHRGSNAAAVCAGVVFAATAYIAYYYVVYLGFFIAVYLAAWVRWLAVVPAPRPLPPVADRLRIVSIGVAAVAAGAAAAILVTGGGSIALASQDLSIRTPQNALTVMWIGVAGWIACTWRVVVRQDSERPQRLRRAIALAWRVTTVFAVGASPLLWQAARLVMRGEYVTQEYGWRSIPHGVDLLSPLLGHPLHPLMADASTHAYQSLKLDYVEAIGWIGLVPVALLVLSRSAFRKPLNDEVRLWSAIAIAFVIFALGPFLTIGGFDTGLKLPEILMRFVPFAANARMPGRAMIGVFMSLAVLLGMLTASATGWRRSPAVQWLLIGLVAFEYWDAPIRMTSLDRPAVYRALAAAEPGAVCEAPFGIGDGLSAGLGSQDRRVLFYATQHEHPLVGGYIGRMPIAAADWYRKNSFTAALLNLSVADPAPLPVELRLDPPPCRYLIVDRTTSSEALRGFVERLHADRLASDERRELYRLP
jgi:hypothetical protein